MFFFLMRALLIGVYKYKGPPHLWKLPSRGRDREVLVRFSDPPQFLVALDRLWLTPISLPKDSKCPKTGYSESLH